MIVYCDVENCIYNEFGKCGVGTAELAGGECITFVGKESEVGEEMIVYCDVENCIYNEYGKCGAGTPEIS